MPKHTLKRFMPTPARLKQVRILRLLGDWLYQPNLWHINRNSAARAFFLGLFLAFVPLPIQMLLAAVLAVRLRANLPLSVALSWINNPLTFAPMFYLAYRVGAVVMGKPPQQLAFDMSWEWISSSLVAVWQPFLLGCAICGFFFGSLGFFAVQYVWRWQAVQRWEARRLRRRLALEKATRDVALRQAAIAQRDGQDTALPDSTTAPPPR
ncbi:MAG: DUF2062 domain-containing protein [Halieaceae bacterium]|jgi:uncharacterized protein (DUF2062 family)|nr:DUF2062 domain-containing protein [Halieaceae bacterium]